MMILVPLPRRTGPAGNITVIGRTRMYEAIVKGENVLECGIPESFNVLMKELQALCLDVDLVEDDVPGAPERRASI